MNKVITFIVFSVLFQSCNKPKNADSSWIKNKHIDIPYATESNAQKLDIYLPFQQKHKRNKFLKFYNNNKKMAMAGTNQQQTENVPNSAWRILI